MENIVDVVEEVVEEVEVEEVELQEMPFLTEKGAVKNAYRQQVLKTFIPKIVDVLNESGEFKYDFEVVSNGKNITIGLGKQGEEILRLNLKSTVTNLHFDDQAKRKSRAGKSKKSETVVIPDLFQ